jgi:hypothetical protein
MRPPFSDWARTQRLARSEFDNILVQLKRWWVRNYKLPPNHELFLSMTPVDLYRDYFEHLLDRKEQLKLERKEAKETRARYDIDEQIRSIDVALGLSQEEIHGSDPLIDKWEAEFEKGIIPDMEADIERERALIHGRSEN